MRIHPATQPPSDEHRAAAQGRPTDRPNVGAPLRRGAGNLGPRPRASVATPLPRLHGGACRAFHRRREVRQGQGGTRRVSGRAERGRGRWLGHGGRHLYTFFFGLAITGWAAGAPRMTGEPSMRATQRSATLLMAAMFVGTYLGQLRRSPWYAVPATIVAGTVAANIVAQPRPQSVSVASPPRSLARRGARTGVRELG